MVQQDSKSSRPIDRFDRTILGQLIRDAAASYATLSERVGLSAPAIHERVKRLRRDGIIKRTTVAVDPVAVGKPLLTFVLVEFSGWGKTRSLMELAKYPEIEEMHSVAGDSGMLVKVRTADAHALELLLAQFYQLSGVRTTKSYITLSTFLERGTKAEITQDWPPLPFDPG